MIHGLFLLEYTQKEQTHYETCLNCYPLHTREQTACYMFCFDFSTRQRNKHAMKHVFLSPSAQREHQLVCNGIVMDLDVLLTAQGHPPQGDQTLFTRKPFIKSNLPNQP